jgi:transposase InsO family protein
MSRERTILRSAALDIAHSVQTISVTDHPTAPWFARQIANAFPWDEVPRCLIRDRDAAYGHAVRRQLQVMGIRDRPTAPRSPWQNAYAERLVGSIRRECLDHIIVLGEAADPEWLWRPVPRRIV